MEIIYKLTKKEIEFLHILRTQNPSLPDHVFVDLWEMEIESFKRAELFEKAPYTLNEKGKRLLGHYTQSFDFVEVF